MSDVDQPAVIRSPIRVTLSVWYALLMREAVSRTVGNRMAWFWAVMEPVAAILIMVGIRTLRSGGRLIDGVDFMEWSFIGLITFQLFRSYSRLIGAIDSSKGLFTYRQVKPIDTVLTRSVYDFLFLSLLLFLFIVVGGLMQWSIVPDHPLEAMFAWFSTWILGLSVGVIASAAATIVPEIATLVKLAGLPLFIISGVIIPLNYIPQEYLHYLLYNPVVHAIECTRLAFLNEYHGIDGISMLYLWECSLTMLVLGLMMHVKFQDRIKAN